MKIYRPVLNFYLARSYAAHISSLLFILLAVISLFDAIELMRRLSKAPGAGGELVAYLTLLKIPGNILMIAPFVVLFAAMFTLSVLNRRQEFMVMRTAGASLWQLMIPFFAVAFMFGVILVGMINPLSAITQRSYQQYEEKFLKKESHMISLLGQGLWLRQTVAQTPDQESGYLILHARKVSLPEWDLEQVIVLSFDETHHFRARLDAPSATLEKGHWLFPQAVRTRSGAVPEKVSAVEVPTTLTRADLEESFSTPETISFWQMPSFIGLLKNGGFPVLPLQVHFGALLMLPFLCAALVMIAVTVSIRPVRAGGQVRLVVFGICAGFIIFFVSNFLQALGGSGQIPVWLASIGPTFLTVSAGVIAIFAMEDQ